MIKFIFRGLLDGTHRIFVEHVKESRGKRLVKSKDIFSGEFWHGDKVSLVVYFHILYFLVKGKVCLSELLIVPSGINKAVSYTSCLSQFSIASLLIFQGKILNLCP